jgi:GDPmannose 4,6-dehydratase
MLQRPAPQDYVVGMGETHSVRELVDIAFRHVGLDYRQHVVSDPRFYRPAEVELLLADPSKAHRELGWRPKVSFEQLITMMVDADLARLSSARRP